MKIKKKWIILCLAFVAVVCSTILAAAESSRVGLYSRWGKILKDASVKEMSVSESDININSNVISVSSANIQQAKEFYVLTGISESEAETKAIDYMKKREAMYVDALRHGYDVTDQEIWEYLDELKQTMEKSENKAEIEALISSFGTLEEYWQYEFTVYEKNLPIQNYVEDMEAQFKNQTETTYSLDGAYEEEWDQYFENYKNRLVQENSFRIIQQ